MFAALVAVHLPDLWGGAARRLQPSSRRVAVCSGDMHPWTTWTGCCREMAGEGCSGEGAAGTLLWWWHLALGLPFPAAGVLAAPALAGAPTLKSIPLQEGSFATLGWGVRWLACLPPLGSALGEKNIMARVWSRLGAVPASPRTCDRSCLPPVCSLWFRAPVALPWGFAVSVHLGQAGSYPAL